MDNYENTLDEKVIMDVVIFVLVLLSAFILLQHAGEIQRDINTIIIGVLEDAGNSLPAAN
ncbi:hypothetical protein [Maribacter sp. 2307ULW6-5]|uniref:hypothetical protein n=1 Tax=Maribacter sp. 2307ULW6-5 TaxID=3386275 RepID=UPI0039BD0941